MVGLADRTSKLMCYVVNNLLHFFFVTCIVTRDLFGVLYIDFPCVRMESCF